MDITKLGVMLGLLCIPTKGLVYSKLGMEDLRLTDSQITASSCSSSSYCTNRARLQGLYAWKPRTLYPYEFIQVDLRSLHQVGGVMTQGRSNSDEWVTSFRVQYSLDGLTWTSAVNAIEAGSEIFEGNTDRDTIETNDFAEPVTARFVRLLPVTWRSEIAIRFEILGKVMPKMRSEEAPLGMRNGQIPDTAISASSVYDEHTGPIMARLDSLQDDGKNGSWSPSTNDVDQWIQVDLRAYYMITGLITRGRQGSDHWVTGYKVAYSQYGITWDYITDCNGNNKVFTGNSESNNRVTAMFAASVRARLVRIYPSSWNQQISMAFEILGMGPVAGERFEPLELGMQDRRISDRQLRASSCLSNNSCAHRSRLNQEAGEEQPGAWLAKLLDHTQWIEINLGTDHEIKGIITQGRSDADEWVSSFTMQYKSSEEAQFSDVLDITGSIQAFKGNSDRNSQVVNKLSVPVIARFVRILPATWNRHISMRFELLGQGQFSDEQAPGKLGIGDGRVSLMSLAASSCKDSKHCVAQSRLNQLQTGSVGGAWTAASADGDQWIQVDMRSAFKVTGVITQGKHETSTQLYEWVTSYAISYSINGKDWIAVTDCGPANKRFRANFDGNSPVHNAISPPVTTRFFRLHPIAWNNAISLRWELIGSGPVSASSTNLTLGLDDYRIPTSAITASSSSGSNVPDRVRLNRSYAWSAGTLDHSQWVQVHFRETHHVTGIITQGRSDADQWVSTFKVAHSMDGREWSVIQMTSCAGPQDRVFSGNNDRSNTVTNRFSPPITARFIRVLPQAWHGHMSMRMELLGVGVVANIINDLLPLGLENYNVQNDSMTASSSASATIFAAYRGRLNLVREGSLRGCWASGINDVNQWIQVDLLKLFRIIGLATQGRHDHSEWVLSYKVACSMNGVNFDTVQGICSDAEEDLTFTGNSDQHTIITNALPEPPICQYVRVLPQTWYNHISMRMELYGEGPFVSAL